MSSRRHFIGATSLAVLLSACVVGPEFRQPTPVPPISSILAGHEAVFANVLSEASPPDQWWTVFDDRILTSLEHRMETQNLDIQAASARLLEARTQRRIVGADRYPSIGGSSSYQRTRISPNGPLGTPPPQIDSPSFNVFDGGFDASWELDLWGRVRRNIEAASAREEAAAENRRLALLSVEAELARDYISLRGSQALLDVLTDNLEIARNSVTLTRSRFANGVTTRLDVANAEAQVSSVEASIPPIEAARDNLLNSLCLLLALPPRALTDELSQSPGMPARPKDIPVGLPSDLLLQRPDIRRAEAQLHAATAEIGVAKADFFPRILLTGSFASDAVQLSSFGNWASLQFSAGPSVTLPFFQGGRLRGMLELRKAQHQEAAIEYQQVVLGAWHEVDNALIDYTAEERRGGSLAHAIGENQLALSTARRRYQEGAVDFLNVLSVQKALLDTRTEAIRSNVSASVDLIKLFKALGGGWETSFPLDNRPQSNTAGMTSGAASGGRDQ